MFKNNKKIRVAIFIEGRFLPSYDGANNRFHYLSKFLQKSKKVDVVIFHCHRGYTDINLIKKEKFKTYLISEENYYHNLELLSFIIKKEQVDILQFNDLEPILYQGVLLSKMTNTKLIYEIHYNSTQLAKALGEKEVAINKIVGIQSEVGNNIDYAICLSSDDKKECIKNLQIKDEEIVVIPSGVDLVKNKYYKPNLKNKTIVFLGNLYFQPNEDAVRILKDKIYPKLIDHGFSFVIAGDFPEKLKCELSDRDFDFIGVVKDLNYLFKKSTLCVAPIFEGTGMRIKFLNFMSGGIPILTTSLGANGFINKSNFIIEDDIKKYSDKILDLFKSKTILKISQYGRKFVEENYSWQKISDEVIKTYQKVLIGKTKDKGEGHKISEKPAWLKELIKKERYKVISQLPNNFSFSEIKKGEITNFILKDVFAIEGMPGAGKTTFVNNLKDNKVKTIKELYVKIPKNIKNKFEIQKRYLVSEKEKYTKAGKLFKEFEKIILDRSFISTLAYCYADCKTRKNMKDYEKLLELLKKIKHEILWPTRIIILDCSIDESITRRKEFKYNPEYKNWFNKTFLENLKDFYYKELPEIIKIKTILIDTTNKTIPEVDELIKKHI